MKRLITILALVLVLMAPSHPGLTTTYFGYCDPSTGAGTGSTNVYPDKCQWFTAGYACPGTGNQDIVTLGVYTNDSPGADLRLAIYDSVGDLVVQGNAAKACAYGDWVSWSSAELTWSKGTTLTGGATYRLAYTNTPINRCVGTVGTSGDTQYVNTDYTTGFPSTIPSGSNGDTILNMRCGVQPAASPPTMINNVLIIIGRFMGL